MSESKKIILDDRIQWQDDNECYHKEDGPAIIYTSGWLKSREEWFIHGNRHRLDGPAFMYTEGQYKYIAHYFIKNKLHRVKGPALTNEDQRKEWYRDNKRHRLNAPASLSKDNLNKRWWEFGFEILK